MKNYQTEHAEQSRLFSWARHPLIRRANPALRFLFAIPNGGHRHIQVAKSMQAEGLTPGVPDICLPVERRYYHGMWIELKVPSHQPRRGGKGGLSDCQARWLRDLAGENHCAIVCYGCDDAQKAIVAYLNGEQMDSWEKRTEDCVAACIGEEVAA